MPKSTKLYILNPKSCIYIEVKFRIYMLKTTPQVFLARKHCKQVELPPGMCNENAYNLSSFGVMLNGPIPPCVAAPASLLLP